VKLVVAVGENGVIGRNGALPWHIPEELRLFRRLTWGGTLIMGRKTFESLSAPLVGRKTVVVGRRPPFVSPDAVRGDEKTYVVGGAEIYRLFWPRVDEMFVSLVHCRASGDVFLPEEILAVLSGSSEFACVESRFHAVLPTPFTLLRFRRHG
jgi:dihydrofolate reductase